MADVSLFILLAFLMAYCHLSKVCACLFKLLKSSAVMLHWSVVGGWLNNSNKFVQTNNIDAFFWKNFWICFSAVKSIALRRFAEMLPWERGKSCPDQLGFILECAIPLKRRGSLQLGWKLQLWRKSPHHFFSLPFKMAEKICIIAKPHGHQCTRRVIF